MIPRPDDIIGLWRHGHEHAIAYEDLIQAITQTGAFRAAVHAISPTVAIKYNNGNSLGLEDNLLLDVDGNAISTTNKHLTYISTHNFVDDGGAIYHDSTGDPIAAAGDLCLPLQTSSKHLIDSNLSQGSVGHILTNNSAGYPQWLPIDTAKTLSIMSQNGGPINGTGGFTSASGQSGRYALYIYVSSTTILAAGLWTCTIQWTDPVAAITAVYTLPMTALGTLLQYVPLRVNSGSVVVTVTNPGLIGTPTGYVQLTLYKLP